MKHHIEFGGGIGSIANLTERDLQPSKKYKMATFLGSENSHSSRRYMAELNGDQVKFIRDNFDPSLDSCIGDTAFRLFANLFNPL